MDCKLSDEITALMAETEVPLLRYAIGIVKSQETAQDIVQDAFIKYLRYRREQREVENAKAWLYRVVHNLGIDYLRRRSRIVDGDDELTQASTPSQEPAPDEVLDRRDATRSAMAALDILSERDRGIVIMKVIEERSYKEIAADTGLKIGNIGFILHTAMKKLARELERQFS
ncbi:MAG: RNA polymerase sigma factor (sigma-70 family) [Rhodothermales bacterium]